ncbi:hypothetical protein FGIG_10676 [Fasciola gigantica]|uniref:Uncharacterized protein n=1 Tax=Fasciola gigantica TaxID=46835 RepID=A0A504YNU7_FASGI|nr:hypothetical protein FGIG_10676 [Fasciola gigantica]
MVKKVQAHPARMDRVPEKLNWIKTTMTKKSLQRNQSKRGRPPKKSSRPTPTTKSKRKRTVVSTDSKSEEDAVDKLDPKCWSSIAAAAKSDEDMPLSALAPPKPGVVPLDAELKRSNIDLLNTVNLEENSLKPVR